MTLVMPRRSATERAWSGPAPPKAMRAKSRVSRPALHRDQADGIGHVLIHRADDGERRVLGRERQGLAQPGEGRTRGREVQRHGPAEEEGGIETAQHQIGVGDGGRFAAAAIGDRPRLGPGALRADMQQPALVDPGDGAAARPDGAHGDAGDGDGNAEIDLELGRILLAALEDQADIRAGAADIEGEGARVPASSA